MRTLLLTLLSIALFGACEPWKDITDVSDGGIPVIHDLKCPPLPDLMPAATCAAAKGLSGDILSDLCLDMDKIDTQGLMNRNFNLAAPAVNCAGWEVAGNKLQPKAINTTPGAVDCTLRLPSIPIASKYSRVSLAVVHQSTLPDPNQVAKIELPSGTPLRLWDNPGTTVDQRTMIEIDRAKIPGGPTLQVSVQLFAPQSSPMPSWTITSIAVLGNQ